MKERATSYLPNLPKWSTWDLLLYSARATTALTIECDRRRQHGVSLWNQQWFILTTTFGSSTLLGQRTWSGRPNEKHARGNVYFSRRQRVYIMRRDKSRYKSREDSPFSLLPRARGFLLVVVDFRLGFSASHLAPVKNYTRTRRRRRLPAWPRVASSAIIIPIIRARTSAGKKTKAALNEAIGQSIGSEQKGWKTLCRLT